MASRVSQVIWMRVGDEDGYHASDTVEDAAEYLAEFYSLASVERGPRYGVISGDFSGLNYISLYWGLNDEDAEAMRELNESELTELNESLDAIEWCQVAG